MVENESSGVDANRLQDDISGYHISEKTPAVDRGHVMSGMKGSRVKVRDITQEFAIASSELKVGELVKDEEFPLFESVAALEIMDPKMDSGFLAPGERFQDTYDLSREVSPEEVIGIMDQLVCHEMVWHMGHPLSQSLFNCAYIDKLLWPEPKSIADAQFCLESESKPSYLHTVLRAYCLGLIKCCDLVNKQISSEHCYEEEDFVTHLFNRNLLSNISEDEVIEPLRMATQWLGGNDGDATAAIEARLEFRISLLLALSNAHGTSEDRPDTYWQKCTALLPRIRDSWKLGKPVFEAFSIKIQRKLASTVPPRPIVNMNFKDSMAHLEKLCKDGKDINQVLDYHSSLNIMTFVWTFQSRKPQPSVYIRTLLQSLLFHSSKSRGVPQVNQILLNDMCEVTLPSSVILDPKNRIIEVPSDPRFRIAQLMDDFMHRATRCFLDLFRTACQNRSRIRRTLCQNIQDWDDLQLEAEDLDTALQPLTKEMPLLESSLGPEPAFAFPVSSWVYHHKLRQMQWIIQLGFELDIYQPDELGGLYFDLQRVATQHLGHLERIRVFVTRRFAELLDPSQPKVSQIVRDTYTTTLDFLYLATLEESATQAFANGLHYLYTALARHFLLTPPSRPYSTDALRYELRRRPFLQISLPPPLSFTTFQSQVGLSYLSTADLLRHASSALLIARKHLDVLSKLDKEQARCLLCESEWRDSVKAVLRSVILASISVSKFEQALRRGEVEVKKLRFNLKTGIKGHEWWISPTLA